MRGHLDADTFVFADGHGNDTIVDFEALNALEVLDFSALSTLNTTEEALAAATQDGTSVVISTGADSSITLYDVTLADLDASDFVF